LQCYGFLAQEKDIGGTIQFIDDVQRYDGIVGQVPELRHLLHDNLICQSVMTFLSPPQIKQMALGEVQKRKAGGGPYLDPGRKDMLGQLLEANAKDPARLSELDMFSVAHGAM
jgi:hypothetical protein